MGKPLINNNKHQIWFTKYGDKYSFDVFMKDGSARIYVPLTEQETKEIADYLFEEFWPDE